MDLKGKTALVLGGAGLVGRAVNRELLAEGVATLLVGGLTEAEARQAVADLQQRVPGAAAVRPVWGNVFVRAALAELPPAALRADPALRSRLLADALEELTPEVYHASHLVQLVLGTSPQAAGTPPDVIVDAVNTATALAYGGLYDTVRRVLAKRGSGDAAGLLVEVDELLAALAIPWLVRHVQLLSQAMIEAHTSAYVKIGTTGTGGMGLNIPYTHGEEKPSRVLLSKSALAGAHSMLLLLLARTPGAPAIKEIKPAAAITWKRIAYGPIEHRGRAIRLYDCPPEDGLALTPGAAFRLDGSGRALDGVLESVFIDTGENGFFSLAEFSAITALGQMEAVTPEEIAAAVAREIRGQTTGLDVVASLDSAVMGPSYRAGVLRQHAIREARSLAEQHAVASVAFEILGPPRLSKLLYEAELLRHAFGTLEAVSAAEPEEIAAGLEQAVRDQAALRRAAISVGIPVLMADGRTLLCAARGQQPHRWEQAGWEVNAANLERWAQAEWIDLRPTNAARWRARAAAVLQERAAELSSGLTSSQLHRRFKDDPFDIGEIAAWIFIAEDGGMRTRELPL
jgi:NAD(P)-dependent dehydrogenase (short-subunit alcohol dehydrogenase family)